MVVKILLGIVANQLVITLISIVSSMFRDATTSILKIAKAGNTIARKRQMI